MVRFRVEFEVGACVGLVCGVHEVGGVTLVVLEVRVLLRVWLWVLVLVRMWGAEGSSLEREGGWRGVCERAVWLRAGVLRVLGLVLQVRVGRRGRAVGGPLGVPGLHVLTCVERRGRRKGRRWVGLGLWLRQRVVWRVWRGVWRVVWRGVWRGVRVHGRVGPRREVGGGGGGGGKIGRVTVGVISGIVLHGTHKGG